MAKKKVAKKNAGNANANQRPNPTPKAATKDDPPQEAATSTPTTSEPARLATPVSPLATPTRATFAPNATSNGHNPLPKPPIIPTTPKLVSKPSLPVLNSPVFGMPDADGDIQMAEPIPVPLFAPPPRPVFGPAPPPPPPVEIQEKPVEKAPLSPIREKEVKEIPVNGIKKDILVNDTKATPVSDTKKEVPVNNIKTKTPVNDVKPEPPKPKQEPEVLSPEAEELKEQGNAQYKSKNYTEAIEFYTRAINLRPTEPSYLNNRAAAYMAIKRFKPALSDCQSAASLQSSSPSSKTLNRVAKCHLALGAPSACILTLQQVLAIDPKDNQALECRKKADVMQEYLDRFDKAKSLKDWGQARWALDRATDECEGDQPILWRVWKVEVDIARRKWDDAIQQASDAIRLDQNDPDALAVRGLALFLTNKMQLAIDHLAIALRLDQEHSRARTLLRRIKDVEKKKEEGNVAFKSNKLDTAVEKWTETLEVIDEKEEEGGGGHVRAVLLSNRATAYQKLNKNNEALKDIEASLVLLPTSFKALRTRARIRLAKEEYDQAVRDFKEAQEAAEGSSEAKPADVKSLAEELKQAEIQLKRSKTKDYYKILGLEKTCTEVEIKKAYRKESLRHHPDKGGDEEKFKLVVEAHTVLSDPQRRHRYDNGIDEDGSMEGGAGMGGFGDVDLNDILFAMGGGGGGGGGPFRSSFGGGGFPGGGRSGGPFGGGQHFHSHGF